MSGSGSQVSRRVSEIVGVALFAAALIWIVALTSYNPARRFGLPSKGDIAPGLDADLAILDPNDTWVVRAKDSESHQGYTPFEGMELSGRVKTTFLRGNIVFDGGKIVGRASGKYLRRPY